MNDGTKARLKIVWNGLDSSQKYNAIEERVRFLANRSWDELTQGQKTTLVGLFKQKEEA